MYDTISPPRIFFCNDVAENADALARAERIMAAYPNAEVVRFDRQDLGDVMVKYGLGSVRPRMGMKDVGDPDLFLTCARFADPDAESPEVKAIGNRIENPDSRMILFLLGYCPWQAVWLGGPKHTGKIAMCADNVCRPAWRLHTMLGCPHHCVYCHFGEIVPIYLNLKEYCVHLKQLIEANPWQKVFLYDDAAEALFPEPELGAVEEFVKCCRQFPDRYLVIHTKSANVDFLESLDHQGRCIMTWSLTSAIQSRETERLSATMEERIEAARKVVSWGYPARVKFKPIVPFKGWRDHSREMIGKLLTTVKLDNISLFTIAWMGVDEFKACFPVEMLDPDFLQEAEKAKEAMEKRAVRPYPHQVRAEVYRFFVEEIRKYDRDVPITLCTEATDMWEEFAPILDRKPGNFVCGCGPMTIPGLKRLQAHPWQDPKPVSVWTES
ncbi:MAG: radical SAM protein [Planctomycetota bacterium]